MILFITLMAGGSGAGQQPNSFGFFLPIIMIFLIMYFLIFRPQMKKQKEQKLMLEAVKKGDKIVTVGGIFGTVVGIKEKENVLIVKIAENTKIELVKTSVAKVIGREE
ncbi:preprotein translocase subunit YajC [candidate division KSB1 bacterium]|nr:preprotein translocase subunit YajC [candidate division KSB1 bacterium]